MLMTSKYMCKRKYMCVCMRCEISSHSHTQALDLTGNIGKEELQFY